MKLDRMTTILEEASHELHAEEGGLTFQEKMRPLFEKMNKVLEQNSEIAKGIVALADLIEELKGRMEGGYMVKEQVEQPPMGEMPMGAPMGPPMGPPPLGPPGQFGPPPMQAGPAPRPLPGIMPPPPPRKKGLF
mgnify:FL=1